MIGREEESWRQMLLKQVGVSWYTVDDAQPYLMKGSCSAEGGYLVMVTDLESTYVCEGDQE